MVHILPASPSLTCHLTFSPEAFVHSKALPHISLSYLIYLKLYHCQHFPESLRYFHYEINSDVINACWSQLCLPVFVDDEVAFYGGMTSLCVVPILHDLRVDKTGEDAGHCITGLRDLKDSQQLIFISHVNSSNCSSLTIIVRMTMLGPDLVAEGAVTENWYICRQRKTMPIPHRGSP